MRADVEIVEMRGVIEQPHPPRSGMVDDGERRILPGGRRLFAVHDDTLPDAGLVGIWSKADSVTEFNQFRQEGTP